MILEYNQYSKYLDDKEFMEYFNNLKEKVQELFPDYNHNLELIIDKIYNLYEEELSIDDAINRLNLDGNLFKYYSGIGDI